MPNEALRQAVLAGDKSLTEIARDLGMVRPDTARLRRLLGISANGKGGRRYRQAGMSYDNAVRIASAADIDPVDVGL